MISLNNVFPAHASPDDSLVGRRSHHVTADSRYFPMATDFSLKLTLTCHVLVTLSFILFLSLEITVYTYRDMSYV